MAKRGFFGMTTPPRPKSGAFRVGESDEKHNNRSRPSRFARIHWPDLVGGAVKSMHRTPAGKLIISVSDLRDELVASKWRMATVCLAHGETPRDVKAALKLTSVGQALLVEYAAKRPKSGPSGPSGRRVNPRAGHRVEVWLTADELKDVRSAASGPVGPWIARVAVERARTVRVSDEFFAKLKKSHERLTAIESKKLGGKCEFCEGVTVHFRGEGLDSQYMICANWEQPGHLSRNEIKERIAEWRGFVNPSGRLA